MAERIGTLLWQWRQAAGLSQGALAQRAGVSRSALSQWESGRRQPRVRELEATLEALGVTPSQRALALASVQAPRALRLLRAPSAEQPGSLPGSGELLRALRVRGGWTQAEIAQRMGVQQHTISRWELGERLPSTEEMQTLCFVLEALEDEIVALTTGRFAETPQQIPADAAEMNYRLNRLLNSETPSELGFLTLERALWNVAVRDDMARSWLAETYAYHAHYFRLFQRWREAEALAQRVLALTPRQEREPPSVLRAVLVQAATAVYKGDRPMPERGVYLLYDWLSQSLFLEFTSWIVSDIAKYQALAGQTESAVSLAGKAISISERERSMREIDLGHLLVANGQPDKALRHLPGLSERSSDRFVYETLVRVEAYLALGALSEAHERLERAYAVIEKYFLKRQRAQADALAKRL